MLFFPACFPLIRGAHWHVASAARMVAGAPQSSQARHRCFQLPWRLAGMPRVWYSPEIDTSNFTLHILSDTPRGSKWLKYILLLRTQSNLLCCSMHCMLYFGYAALCVNSWLCHAAKVRDYITSCPKVMVELTKRIREKWGDWKSSWEART